MALHILDEEQKMDMKMNGHLVGCAIDKKGIRVVRSDDHVRLANTKYRRCRR